MSEAIFHNFPAAPEPVAPFSHAVEADGWVQITGQMPTDPADAAKPLPEGIEAQTRRVMDNLVLVLGELGLGLEHVTSARAFLTHFERDYAGMNDGDDRKGEGIDHDMTLAPHHLLARVKAPDTAAFRGFHRLAVDHARRKGRPRASPGPERADRARYGAFAGSRLRAGRGRPQAPHAAASARHSAGGRTENA